MTPLSHLDRLRGLRVLVGNTPLLAVSFSTGNGIPRRIYAKAEHSNMTGSIKDRMAYHLIRRAIESGELDPGDRRDATTSRPEGKTLRRNPRLDLFARTKRRGDRDAYAQQANAASRVIVRNEEVRNGIPRAAR